MTHVYPYLSFDGNCREAMAFYQSCLGGNAHLQTVGESPMADRMPPDKQQHVMHSRLEKNSQILFFASDMIGENGVKAGNTLALTVIGDSKLETETIFASLAEKGKITTPLHQEPFGLYGDLIDQFGLRWMFQYDTNNQT